MRAEVLRRHTAITLPDQFPALYERLDSPHQQGVSRSRPHAWVVSSDIAMLEELLPRYQELWDAYTAQWGPDSRRLFAVGRLDGLSPNRVYLPGTSPEQVLTQTLRTHTDMRPKAPDWARELF